MPIIGLRIRRGAGHVVRGWHLFQDERLVALTRFGDATPATWADCMVDSGAAFSVIPAVLWGRFAPEVAWLEPAEEAGLPPWLRAFAGAAGGRVPIRLGSVRVTLADLAAGTSVSLTLLAAFVLDDSRLLRPRPLLGLGGGLFDACQLHVNYKQARAWLEFP
jgi:hypothetical protein